MTLKETVLHRWLSVPYILHHDVYPPATSKKALTVLFIHGIGNSGAAWRAVIDSMPKDVRLVTIDLLGFGNSESPPWAIYSAKTQARSVVATLLRLRLQGRIIIVGHSLGALVAVEIAKRYPLLVRSLVLCSPPFYRIDKTKHRQLPSSDRVIRKMFQMAHKHPEQFVRISDMAVKLGLVNESYNLSRDNAATYMNALEASIINQTSLSDAATLDMPIRIIYGRLDPIVVAKNLRRLAKANPRVKLASVLAAHEVKGRFVGAAIKEIKEAIRERK